ncbi:hypothetical protein M0Q50_06370 [bacterium]|jgi:hypothetical protein|nr:hypothetical protein [bacterium]
MNSDLTENKKLNSIKKALTSLYNDAKENVYYHVEYGNNEKLRYYRGKRDGILECIDLLENELNKK